MIRPVPTLTVLAVMASSACVARRSASMAVRRRSLSRRKWATVRASAPAACTVCTAARISPMAPVTWLVAWLLAAR